MGENCRPIIYDDPNITAYVFQALGPRCADESLVTPTVILYVSILVIGILGNICTCLVIFLNKNMRTPTNYYLFSLAISDLLMLILGLPVELYGVFYPIYPYQFGELTCKLRAFLIEFTSYASIVTITGFSVERWLAICFPIRARLVSTFDRAVGIIIAIWITSFLAAFPVFFIVVINRINLQETGVPYRPEWLGTVTFNNNTVVNTEFCALDSSDPNAQQVFILGAFIIFFLLPALIITAVYSHILLKIHQTDKMLGPEQRNKTKQRKALIRMLATVVCLFFLCWIPFHAQRLISVLYPINTEQLHGFKKAFFNSLFYMSGCFYYSNSALNPIVYNIMSTKYRRAFIKTIFCWNCSEGFYTKLNLSTYSKNRNSLSKMRTRSLSQAQHSPNKKSSAESILLAQRSVRSTNGRPL